MFFHESYLEFAETFSSMETLLKRIKREAKVACDDMNSWTQQQLSESTHNWSCSGFYSRPVAFETLSDTVKEGNRLLNVEENILHVKLEKLKDQRNQLNKALILRPDTRVSESMTSFNPQPQWGGYKYKEVQSEMTEFNVDNGWIYSSLTPLCTTYYRDDGVASHHVKHK